MERSVLNKKIIDDMKKVGTYSNIHFWINAITVVLLAILGAIVTQSKYFTELELFWIGVAIIGITAFDKVLGSGKRTEQLKLRKNALDKLRIDSSSKNPVLSLEETEKYMSELKQDTSRAYEALNTKISQARNWS